MTKLQPNTFPGPAPTSFCLSVAPAASVSQAVVPPQAQLALAALHCHHTMAMFARKLELIVLFTLQICRVDVKSSSMPGPAPLQVCCVCSVKYDFGTCGCRMLMELLQAPWHLLTQSPPEALSHFLEDSAPTASYSSL